MAAVEEFVMVPTPREAVVEVYELIARRRSGNDEEVQGGVIPEEPAKLTEELIRRMYDESDTAHRELMVFLARSPEKWFYTSELASALKLAHGSRSLAGMLGAFGKRAWHRYDGLTPWHSEWDGARQEARHRMSAEVAKVLSDHIKK